MSYGNHLVFLDPRADNTGRVEQAELNFNWDRKTHSLNGRRAPKQIFQQKIKKKKRKRKEKSKIQIQQLVQSREEKT